MGSGSYPEQWQLDKRSAQQEAENKQKKEEIKKIRAELDDVKSGDAAIEERARSELGMTGQGETFFEVILQPDNKAKSEVTEKAEQIQTTPEKNTDIINNNESDE